MSDFSKRLIIPDFVLIRDAGEEAILLNLNSGQYYSLDPIGKHMLQVLKEEASMEQGILGLIEEYDVDPVVLRSDLQELVQNLLDQGLIEIR
jgi:hypothetical protein